MTQEESNKIAAQELQEIESEHYIQYAEFCREVEKQHIAEENLEKANE